MTGSKKDEALRKKWLENASTLLQKIERAKLTTNARRKLGNYSGRDYQRWQQQINSGTIKNYSIDKLNDDTNKKFYRLFPNQPQEQIDQQTFAQIWYAIAADNIAEKQ